MINQYLLSKVNKNDHFSRFHVNAFYKKTMLFRHLKNLYDTVFFSNIHQTYCYTQNHRKWFLSLVF